MRAVHRMAAPPLETVRRSKGYRRNTCSNYRTNNSDRLPAAIACLGWLDPFGRGQRLLEVAVPAWRFSVVSPEYKFIEVTTPILYHGPGHISTSLSGFVHILLDRLPLGIRIQYRYAAISEFDKNT